MFVCTILSRQVTFTSGEKKGTANFLRVAHWVNNRAGKMSENPPTADAEDIY